MPQGGFSELFFCFSFSELHLQVFFVPVNMRDEFSFGGSCCFVHG